MYHATKKKVYSLLHPEVGDTKLDKVINAFLIFLIASNIVAVILETVPRIYQKHETFFHYFDLVSVIIFSIEYVLRVWSANFEEKYKHSIHGRLRYMLSWPALIDLLAILPVYVHVFVGLDLRILRIFQAATFLSIISFNSLHEGRKTDKKCS